MLRKLVPAATFVAGAGLSWLAFIAMYAPSERHFMDIIAAKYFAAATVQGISYKDCKIRFPDEAEEEIGASRVGVCQASDSKQLFYVSLTETGAINHTDWVGVDADTHLVFPHTLCRTVR